jgi:hypothetical protein
MNERDLLRLKQELSRDGVLISFSGPFSHSIIEELGQAMRQYMESESVARAAMMDVFSVYIEQTQNVRNYTRRHEGEGAIFASGIVVIARQGERYAVCSGNLVQDAEVAALAGRIDRLRGLDRAGLKALYKEQMRRPAEGAGAGVGLIDMARRASEPLHYTLQPMGNGRTFFSLRAVI